MDSARCLSPVGQCSHPVLAVEPLCVHLVVELDLHLVHHYHLVEELYLLAIGLDDHHAEGLCHRVQLVHFRALVGLLDLAVELEVHCHQLATNSLWSTTWHASLS